MPLRLPKSEISSVELKIIDEKTGKPINFSDHELIGRFRQARQGDVESMVEEAIKFSRVFNGKGEVEVRTDFNYERYKARVVHLTMAGLNLNYQNDDDAAGDPVFKFRDDKLVMDDDEFQSAWDNLTPNIADALAEAAFEVNPSLVPDRK